MIHDPQSTDHGNQIVRLLFSMVEDSIPVYSAGESNNFPDPKSKISLLIPGINLSFAGSLHWFSVLLISTVLHEAGHALLAILHESTVFYIPIGAFVELDPVSFEKSSLFSKLTISSAGSISNFLLSFSARKLLFILPILYHYIGYRRGLVVLHDHLKFGLRKGTIIHSINHQSLSSLHALAGTESSSFIRGYSSLLMNLPPIQHCIPISFIEKREECCSSSGISLHHKDQVNCIWDVPSLHIYEKNSNFGNVIPKYCGLLLPNFCNNTVFHTCKIHRDCSGEASVCMSPFAYHSPQKLIILNTSSVYDKYQKDHFRGTVAFISSPSYFFSSVLLGEFFPKYSFLPLSLPFLCYVWLKYLFSLNFGLGLLNLVPAFELDGARMITLLFGSVRLKIFQDILKISGGTSLIYIVGKALCLI